MLRARCGFTLVEVLVVVAILGLLLALLIPAVQSVRESARRVQCANNLKQMGIAIQLFHDARGIFPHSWGSTDEVAGTVWASGEAITWGRSLLPYIEYESLHRAWNPQIGFFDGPNAQHSAVPIPLYLCPSSPHDSTYQYLFEGKMRTYGANDYKGCQSVNADDPLLAHWGRKGWIPGVIGRFPVKMGKISDGLSQTLLIVESTGGTVIYGPDRHPAENTSSIWFHTDGAWVGRSLSGFSPTGHGLLFGSDKPCTVNCSNMYSVGPYSFHPRGAQVVFADGSTHFLSWDIEPITLAGLYSYDDGDVIGEY